MSFRSGKSPRFVNLPLLIAQEGEKAAPPTQAKRARADRSTSSTRLQPLPQDKSSCRIPQTTTLFGKRQPSPLFETRRLRQAPAATRARSPAAIESQQTCASSLLANSKQAFLSLDCMFNKFAFLPPTSAP